MPEVTTMKPRRQGRPGGRFTPAGHSARVYDLAAVRRRRMTGPDHLPDELWDDITAAGELAEDLAASGHEVRFDLHRFTGRVTASLTDLDGTLLRSVPLHEVVGIDPGPAPAA